MSLNIMWCIANSRYQITTDITQLNQAI